MTDHECSDDCGCLESQSPDHVLALTTSTDGAKETATSRGMVRRTAQNRLHNSAPVLATA